MSDSANEIDVPVKLEYIEALRLAAYNSFNDRRSYEWKLSFTIWTALAILIAGLVQPERANEVFPFRGARYEIGATIFGALVLLLHIYFNNCLARANAIDRIKVVNYSNHIEAALKLPRNDFADHVARRIEELPKYPTHRWLQWWQWGHLVQIAMTVVLTTVAVALVWVRASR